MSKMFYLDIYEYLFLTISDPKTIVQFVKIDREISNMCRKWRDEKKIQCSILIEGKDIDDKKVKYYLLPNGDKHGKFQTFHYDGSLEREVIYIDNKAGVAKGWHKNGQLKSSYLLKEGQMNGVYQGWHKNGKLERNAFYLNGCAHGIYQYWNDNGQLLREGNYRDGGLNGIVRRWDDNGVLIEKTNYVDGIAM